MNSGWPDRETGPLATDLPPVFDGVIPERCHAEMTCAEHQVTGAAWHQPEAKPYRPACPAGQPNAHKAEILRHLVMGANERLAMTYACIDDDDDITEATPVPVVSAEALEAFTAKSALAARLVRLEERFEKTATYRLFRERVFEILADREARMAEGKSNLKGAMLIGPAGAGKSRIVEEIIKEHRALTKHVGNWQYGTRILSVVVPGRSTVKEALNAILKALGHPAKGRRDEEYLTGLVMTYLKLCGVAAVHLDEVQDSGRYKTKDSIDAFLKVFRNMTQDKDWPVCLIMTATPEATDLLNGDKTLLRRIKPMEMRTMTFSDDGQALRNSLKQRFEDACLAGSGIPVARPVPPQDLDPCFCRSFRRCGGDEYRGHRRVPRRGCAEIDMSRFRGCIRGADGLRRRIEPVRLRKLEAHRYDDGAAAVQRGAAGKTPPQVARRYPAEMLGSHSKSRLTGRLVPFPGVRSGRKCFF